MRRKPNRNRDQDARYESTFYNKRWGFVDTACQWLKVTSVVEWLFSPVGTHVSGRCPCGEVAVAESLKKTFQIFHSQDMESALVTMPASLIVTMKI